MSRPSSARLGVLFLVWITACKDGGTPACTPVTFPDPVACDGAAAPRWAIGGFSNDRADAGGNGAGVTVRLNLGESLRMSVHEAIDAGGGCKATVESATWSVSNPSAASLTPVGHEAWITGVAIGETAVSARIVFKDSPPQVVAPRVYVRTLGEHADALVRVVPPATSSAGAVRIAQGTLPQVAAIPAAGDPSAAIPFETSVAGHLDVTVDWTLPTNAVDVVVAGPCPGGCIIIGRTSSEQTKPLHLERSKLPPGPYTLRIYNRGPEPESVSYEVWLTPGG